jgi:hypothetical protein
VRERDGRRTHPDDVLRAGLGGEHAEDAGPAPHVEHRLAREQVAVVHDRGPVRARADVVLEHLLVDPCRHPIAQHTKIKLNTGSHDMEVDVCLW